MQKMRILEVVGSLRVGGQERIAASIIEHIDKDKFQVDYLVFNDVQSDNSEIVKNNHGKIICIEDALSNRFKIVQKLTKAMVENGPYDIVHSHGMFNNGYVMLAAKKAKIKCRIAHSHSSNDGKDTKSIIYKLYKKLMRHYMLTYSTQLVACGRNAGEYLFGKSIFHDRGMIFYNRIDANKFEYNEDERKEFRKALDLENKKIFLIVGHLVPLKNHALAFNAFEQYYNQNKDSRLLVLGDGELKHQLKEIIEKKGLTNQIKLLGNVNNVHQYINAADYLLMPSWYEGFPVTLIEAQASGLRCIVSDTVAKEVDITGLVTWCSLYDLNQWVQAMGVEYNRKNMKDKIIKANFDFSDYKYWLTEFYEESLK